MRGGGGNRRDMLPVMTGAEAFHLDVRVVAPSISRILSLIDRNLAGNHIGSALADSVICDRENSNSTFSSLLLGNRIGNHI
jgi:hypothetical protein